MRGLVFLLLIANGLVLALALGRDEVEAPVERPAPPLPLGVERLRLLSEVEPAERPRPRPPLSGGICVRAGPLSVEADAAAVVERARALGLEARSAALEIVSGPPDLRVHLPPLPSAEQASRAVRELAALDIEAFVIPDGDLAGGVSLGIFTAADAAEARRAEVSRLGYPVRIVEIPRARRVLDVRLRGPDVESLDAFLVGLRADWPELGGDRVACEDEEAALASGTGRGAEVLPRIAVPPRGDSTPP